MQYTIQAAGLLSRFHGNAKTMLQWVFPDVSFSNININYADASACREFFTRVAQEKGIDPLRRDSWQRVTLTDIQTRGVCSPPSFTFKCCG